MDKGKVYVEVSSDKVASCKKTIVEIKVEASGCTIVIIDHVVSVGRDSTAEVAPEDTGAKVDAIRCVEVATF